MEMNSDLSGRPNFGLQSNESQKFSLESRPLILAQTRLCDVACEAAHVNVACGCAHVIEVSITSLDMCSNASANGNHGASLTCVADHIAHASSADQRGAHSCGCKPMCDEMLYSGVLTSTTYVVQPNRNRKFIFKIYFFKI